MSVLLNSMAVVATLVGSVMALPQARRLARTGRAEGVSPGWVGASLAVNGWWIAYGFAVPLWAILPVSIVSFALYAAMAVLLVRTSGRSCIGPLALGVVALGIVPMPFLGSGGWAYAGAVIGFCYGLQLLPAVVAVFRSRNLVGVSPTTWLIAFVEAALWLAYGLGVTDVALVSAGLIGVVMSSLILARLALTGHQPLEVFRTRWIMARASLS